MSEIIKKVSEAVFNKLRFCFRIRKLTPEECFILQGMTADDVAKCRAVGISNSQLYKQAGNGLSTNVIMFIGEHLQKMYNPALITTDEKMVAIYGECK